MNDIFTRDQKRILLSIGRNKGLSRLVNAIRLCGDQFRVPYNYPIGGPCFRIHRTNPLISDNFYSHSRFQNLFHRI